MLAAEVVDELKRLARQRYPHEMVVACYDDGTWQEFANVHPKPCGAWSVSEADEAAIKARPPLVLVHSHPSGIPEPSDLDTQVQIECGYVWAVIAVDGDGQHVTRVGEPEYFGDGAPHAPLLGRTYLWGVRDCYTLIQGYFALQGISIPTVPRCRWPLQASGHHPYARNPFVHFIEKQGLWTKLDGEWEMEAGDVVVYQMTHTFLDHCAVYLGEGKYLEQTARRLSGIRFHLSSYLERKNACYYRLKGYNAKDRASWRIEGAVS